MAGYQFTSDILITKEEILSIEKTVKFVRSYENQILILLSLLKREVIL